MNLIDAIILGLIQGFTEWLPISSSGHLVIAQELLGLTVKPEFDVVLMFGTLLALIVYFRHKLYWILHGLLTNRKESRNYLFFIVLAGFPTALIGFAGKNFFKSLFSNPLAVSFLLVVNGLFLYFATRPRELKSNLTEKNSLLIGIAQGLAIAPGISRSGSTIGTGLLLGVEPRKAAEFSFMIGIPAMLVASALEFQTLSLDLGMDLILAGVIAAFIAGYASIDVLMRLLKAGKLEWFAYYCVLVGAICFALFL
ncbi:undecaprenyl-diphosphate phosphatase [Candidatus Micrarchaeota archaeon]|nr:undecaprenyl-diphosphate phosphatase [Candidatus Micrarchaeota archaeon]